MTPKQLQDSVDCMDKNIHALETTRASILESLDASIQDLKRARAAAVHAFNDGDEEGSDADATHTTKKQKHVAERVVADASGQLIAHVLPRGAHVVPIDVERTSLLCRVEHAYSVYKVVDQISGGELFNDHMRREELTFSEPKQISAKGQRVVYTPHSSHDSSLVDQPLQWGSVVGMDIGVTPSVIVRDADTDECVAVHPSQACVVEV